MVEARETLLFLVCMKILLLPLEFSKFAFHSVSFPSTFCLVLLFDLYNALPCFLSVRLVRVSPCL